MDHRPTLIVPSFFLTDLDATNAWIHNTLTPEILSILPQDTTLPCGVGCVRFRDQIPEFDTYLCDSQQHPVRHKGHCAHEQMDHTRTMVKTRQRLAPVFQAFCKRLPEKPWRMTLLWTPLPPQKPLRHRLMIFVRPEPTSTTWSLTLNGTQALQKLVDDFEHLSRNGHLPTTLFGETAHHGRTGFA